ncbi:MAG: sulfite exporter TauE/SafE family protein [Proteobacteria bacterium]|nr:sulfite exporter TauE/SafE family protein [Pseudomonadota bacterium]
MHILSGFADISVAQLVLVAAVALIAGIIGGVSGYGSGALMPLVLVPMVGAAPVVPIIGLAALFNNFGRVSAYLAHLDRRRAVIATVAALPTCVLGAWGYSQLTGRGAAIVIGAMLMASVPLRRVARRRNFRIDDRGLAVGSVGYGVLVGGTSGSGVIMLTLLMAVGLEGAAVIATDAMVSIGIGVVKVSVFGLNGVLTPKVIALALLTGLVSMPGAHISRLIVQRMPMHVHTAILDFVVLLGGGVMIASAFR